MKLFVAVVLSVTLFLTACGEKNDLGKSTTDVSVTIPEGTPMPPMLSPEKMARVEMRQKRDFCGWEKLASDENSIPNALACKAKAGLEICLESFTEQACNASIDDIKAINLKEES